MQFSLFYFACDEAGHGKDRYRLLIEGARFADAHEFEAVWTPERHFHPFGGLYPNPSLTSAALAMVTERIQLRAGSVVLPLHHPVRVAEEWSVVDNLSKGRVGISFASGWHSNDFVFAPENYPDRHFVMAQQLEIVRKLWRGQSVKSANGAGEEVEVKIFPRPVQPELPVWITASGCLDTFRLAGELGANLLTHLLGQTIGELAAKIAVYREAWNETDHREGSGHVTLMLHAFVGENFQTIQETVREPFRAYLKSSVDLTRKTRRDIRPLSPCPKNGASSALNREPARSEIEPVLDYAFHRYLAENGLFGTPDTCVQTVERLANIGVDEIACLIDFGVEANLVLRNLPFLNEVRKRCRGARPLHGRVRASQPDEFVAGNGSHAPSFSTREKTPAQSRSEVMCPAKG